MKFFPKPASALLLLALLGSFFDQLLDFPPGSSTSLVVHQDGTFELKETMTGATLWEISTYNPLSSESQLFIPDEPDYFLFPNGSKLHEISRSGGTKIHPLSIEEYVAKTPEMRDSTIIVGSQFTTTYQADAHTGEIIYQSPSPASLSRFGVPSQLPFGPKNKVCHLKHRYIIIIRIDYTVSCSDYSRILWSWTSSLFIAFYPDKSLIPSYNAGIIPIQFKGEEFLLAWTHSDKKLEPVKLDLTTDNNVLLKNTMNELLRVLVHPSDGIGFGFHPVVKVISILITCSSLVLLYCKVAE